MLTAKNVPNKPSTMREPDQSVGPDLLHAVLQGFAELRGDVHRSFIGKVTANPCL